MTAVPLPSSPCMRVRLIYTDADGFEAGSRFYIGYTGAAPTGGNCVTLADAIAASWLTRIGPGVNDTVSLTEVDVLDITTDSGLSGQWTGTNTGTDSGTPLPIQIAANVEYGIQRRYRGGKPRIFWPPGVTADLLDTSHWSSTHVGFLNTQTVNFFDDIAAESIGAIGTLSHVNVSYYKGFTNVTNSSGRERAVPTYRSTALVEPVVGYAAKAVLGSQKRRRTATTP